jgi:hypothetical protein
VNPATTPSFTPAPGAASAAPGPALVDHDAEAHAWTLSKVRLKTGLLTMGETERVLGYGTSFLKEEIQRGRLETIGNHRARRILAASVADYIERAQRQAKASAR